MANYTQEPDHITVSEVAESLGVTLTPLDSSAVGNLAAVTYKRLTANSPNMAVKRYIDAKGKSQTTKVASYPLAFRDKLVQLIMLLVDPLNLTQ